MGYPARPHIRFPFTRTGGAIPLDAHGPLDLADDMYDAGVISPASSGLVDAGSPYVVQSGTVQVVEQDSEEHVMSCELVIVSHPLGYRHDRPEFGWAWPELASTPLDLAPLETALRQFEPRGSADATQYRDAANAAMQHISVNVAIQSASESE
jgi:hypothetical protein